MPQVLVFGDSIAYGAWDDQGGWADRLKGWIHQKNIRSHEENTEFYCPLYNLSIPGNTSADLLKRLELEITPRLNPDQETIMYKITFIYSTRLFLKISVL